MCGNIGRAGILCQHPMLCISCSPSSSTPPGGKSNTTRYYGDATLTSLPLLDRVCECIWVSKSSSQAQMNLAMYIVGLVYYIAVPLSLAAESYAFQPRQRDPPAPSHCMQERIGSLSYAQTFGWFIFLVGNYHQNQCHLSLAALRGPKIKAKAENSLSPPSASLSHYRMPVGGWFESLSSPHYSFEILLYTGLVLISKVRYTNHTWTDRSNQGGKGNHIRVRQGSLVGGD